jgi:hypothetical protein
MRMVRSVLILASFFLSASACWGGAVLIAEAHGNQPGMISQIVFAAGPLRAWALPGVVLFGGVGLFGTWTLWANLREQPSSGFWSALEGLVLLCWVLIWRTPIWLHYLYTVLALILIASGLGLQSIGAMRKCGARGLPPRS